MRPETYLSAIILFIATSSVLYGILTIVQPSVIVDKETKKVKKLKALVISTISSLIFSIAMAYISEKIDDISHGEKIIPNIKTKKL